MSDIIKEYSNGEVTIVWNPDICIHSANCFKGLSSVFNPRARPWIDIHGADSDAIRKQVALCPSGALSMKDESPGQKSVSAQPATTEVVVIKNGPLKVKGTLVIKHKNGREEIQQEIYLCRCGQSGNKPYCDGTHKKCGFTDE
jgi:uncharacterized Fe-S cluster protein YjdI